MALECGVRCKAQTLCTWVCGSDWNSEGVVVDEFEKVALESTGIFCVQQRRR